MTKVLFTAVRNGRMLTLLRCRTLFAARFQTAMSPTNRAPRYPLQMTMRFRRSGDDTWLEGRTVDISESGVLFRTSGPPVPSDATLEMALEMSALGPRIANVTCTGRVVRTESASDSATTMAATIERYHLARTVP